MQILLITLMAFLASDFDLAQVSTYKNINTCVIQASIVDSANHRSLAYVTVVIKEAGNQTIKTTLSKDDGSFTFTDLPNKQYQLILSYVGYKTKVINLPQATSAVVDLGTIQLIPTVTQLDEVQIVTTKPIIEQNTDKLIYNVESDPENNILNTLDMLRKVPLLTVDGDDNLQLNGNSNYQILINGKRSSLFAVAPSDVLKLLPANSVKRVEVITNPSAKYEAAGTGGVINIITHKSRISGYNGSVNLGAITPKGFSANTYTNLTLGKTSVSGQASTRSTAIPQSSNYFLRTNKHEQHKLLQKGESNSRSTARTAFGELSYELSPLSMISASYSTNWSNSHHQATQRAEQRNRLGQLTQAYLNLNDSESNGSGNDISLDYQQSFQNNDNRLLSLTFNMLQNEFNNESSFILQPLLNYTGQRSITDVADKTKEYNLQADYVQPIGKQTLELGLKSIFEDNRSEYFYKNQDKKTGAFLLDPVQSSDYSYRQQIHAGYLSLNLMKNKWGIRTGARLERTSLDADFKSSGTEVTQEYHNLCPNISLSYKVSESSMLRLSYNQRIQRPGLYLLNPYADLSDPLNISFGNPNLKPALSHSLQLEYSTFIKNTSVSTLATHNITNNAIESFTTLTKDYVARTTFGNIGSNKIYNLALNANTTFFKKLSISINASINYSVFESMIEGVAQSNEGLSYNLRGAGNYRIGKGWRASGNVSYSSSNIFLQGKSNGYSWSSMAISKEFLKDNKASINLSVRSPFRKERLSRVELDTPTFHQIRESASPLRQFTLTLNYRFGKLR